MRLQCSSNRQRARQCLPVDPLIAVLNRALPHEGGQHAKCGHLLRANRRDEKKLPFGKTLNVPYRGGLLGPWECRCLNTGRATAMCGEAVGPEAVAMASHHLSAAAPLPAAPASSATLPTWMSVR